MYKRQQKIQAKSQRVALLRGRNETQRTEMYRTGSRVRTNEKQYELQTLSLIHILKVDARKNMTFNPKESIDFNGNTGPFIQYTYACLLYTSRCV